MENKAEFIKMLGQALARYSRENVAGIDYEKDDIGNEWADVRYFGGEHEKVFINHDSCIAIMMDVARGIM